MTEILLGVATESNHAKGGDHAQAQDSYRSQVLDIDNPIAYYGMDDISGTVATDLSGNGRHGSYVGSYSLGAPKLVTRDHQGAALRHGISGAGGLTVPYASWMDLPSYSAEIWYRREAGSGGYLMGRGDASMGGGTRTWSLQFSGTTLTLYVFTNSGSWYSTNLGTLNVGQFIHLVYTFEPVGGGLASGKIYVNGTMTSETGMTASLVPNPSTGGLGFGTNYTNTFAANNGTSDEAAYYDYALSAARVAAHYQLGLTTLPFALDARTEIDESLTLLAQREAPIYGRQVILPAIENDQIPVTGFHGPNREFKIPTVVETYSLENLTDTPPWAQATPAGGTVSWNVPNPLQERGLGGTLSVEEVVPFIVRFDQTLELDLIVETETVGTFPHDLGNDIEMVVETSIVESLISRGDLQLTATGTLSLASETITMDPVLALTILDDELRRAPTSLTFMMTGARQGMLVSVYFNNDTVAAWTGEPNSEGMIGPLAINVPNTLLAGAHTLRAEVDAVVVATAPFTLAMDPALYPGTAGADAQAIEVPGAVSHDTRHWVFQDLLAEVEGGIGSFILPINPSEMSSPHQEYGMSGRHTTAVTGQFHIFQTGAIPKEWTFAGYCPNQETQEAMEAYRNLNRRFYIIDHHNRAWKVVITNMEFVPRLRHNFNGVETDWGSDYTVTATILDQDWVTPA